MVFYDLPVTVEPTIREQQREAEAQRTTRTRQTIATVPIFLFTVFAILWAIPATRDLATGRDERNPVEIITFVAMLIAGVMAIRLSLRVWQLGHSVLTTSFFVLFGLVAFAVAGDEIAWGRVIIDFFEGGADAAAASELGLHEIDALRDRTEFLRLGFAAVGIVGVFINSRSRFRHLRAPMELLPWLVVIGGISVLEVIADVADLGDGFEDFLVRVSELTEMMVAVVVLLYIWERTRDMWFRIP